MHNVVSTTDVQFKCVLEVTEWKGSEGKQVYSRISMVIKNCLHTIGNSTRSHSIQLSVVLICRSGK